MREVKKHLKTLEYSTETVLRVSIDTDSLSSQLQQ